jgi:(p)ppGpp synthase/HD superfamily hydrolase
MKGITMSKKTEKSLLSPKFALALQFANEIHSTQTRKGLGAPYISHLMAVSGLVLEYGGNETQAIAALLHDAAEDCGGRPMLETVRVLFGNDVAQIVEDCTDTFDDSKPDWLPRKKAYLLAMANKPGSTKLVACADKLHNISHTLRDIRTEGAEGWKARMEGTRNGSSAKQCWYYLGCLEALSSGWANPILNEFARAVILLCELVGTEEDLTRAHKIAGDEL